MLYGAWAKGARQGGRQGSETGSETGARQVCCLLLPLPAHGGGDLKFQYGGGYTKIHYKILYGGMGQQSKTGTKTRGETGGNIGSKTGGKTGRETGSLLLAPLALTWWWEP